MTPQYTQLREAAERATLGVAVKPLEWEQRGPIARPSYIAESIVGVYTILTYGNHFALVRPQDSFDGFGYYFHGPLNRCKSAAQADYDARIRSALLPDPAILSLIADVEEMLRALEPFAKAAADWSPESNGGHVFRDDEPLEGDIHATVGDLRRARAIVEKHRGERAK